jgi:hypothetical protein
VEKELQEVRIEEGVLTILDWGDFHRVTQEATNPPEVPHLAEAKLRMKRLEAVVKKNLGPEREATLNLPHQAEAMLRMKHLVAMAKKNLGPEQKVTLNPLPQVEAKREEFRNYPVVTLGTQFHSLPLVKLASLNQELQWLARLVNPERNYQNQAMVERKNRC